MVEKYRDYIENISKNTGFIGSTLEKVDRLIRILEWMNSDEKLNKLLALKGGTAINTAIFNFPRLSVDIDLDLTENLSKEEMIKERENIHNLLVNYLNSNNYKINMEKSKNVYALDSIVAEYIDIKGNIDNIKIEINYMNRVHILETKRIDVSTDVLKGKHLTIHCIHPIEIYAAKLCALLSRTTARDLYDVYTLSKYDLFDDEEKKLLKQCLMLEYIAVNDYKLKDMKIDNVERLKRQDIKTKLLPTLKDRNPKNSNIDEMKQAVREYLKDILIVDDKTKEFYDKFQKGIYLKYTDANFNNKNKEVTNEIYESTYGTDDILSNGEIASLDENETGEAVEETTLQPGEAVMTSSKLTDFIIQARIDREQIRSKNKETLLKVINDETVSEKEKTSAVEAMVEITKSSELENTIETLLEAKGFSNVIVTLSDNQVDVIIDEQEITDQKRAQIEETIKRKTDISADKIVITPAHK